MIPKLTDESSAIETAAAIRSGAMSPLEAVDAAIQRIESLDGPINAIVVHDFERARDTAKAMDGLSPGDDQPLFGVPMTVKEAFNVAGLPTSWGVPEFSDFIPQKDAKVVRLLKRAGVILLGKTNVPPLLADWQTENPIYGRTSNPHALDRTPGGSSGGAAAAVAAGMIPAEFGSDTANSIRGPAHFCGVWGHKPTWGLINNEGHSFPKTDCHDIAVSVVGPLARTPEDLDLMLRCTATLPLARTEKPVSEWRVLYLAEHPLSPVDDAVRVPIENAVAATEATGARIATSSDLLPDLAQLHATFMHLAENELQRGEEGPLGPVATLAEWFAYRDTQARTARQWKRLFEDFDFVFAPIAPFVAQPHSSQSVDQRKVMINGELHSFMEALAWPGIANLPGVPATAVPVGASDGLPVGMQVIGPRLGDLDCIAAAKQVGDLCN